MIRDQKTNPFSILKDSFNLVGPEIFILEAYYSYLFQVTTEYTEEDVNLIIRQYPSFFKLLYNYFEVKFSPLIRSDKRKDELKTHKTILKELIDKTKQNQKLLYTFYKLVQYTLSTNYYIREQNNQNYLISLKFKSENMMFLPYPRPFREIFVYGKKFLGIHLRAGKFSRGGIRWSDRSDFRTEILGLMRTQDVKNTIIVPRGGKGGFVIRPEYQKELNDINFVKNEYANFIYALIDVTDNIVDGKVQAKAGLISYDDPDSYMTFAPDKGTGSFSDFANEIAKKEKFWLLDSFASGSSIGYNHKSIGITSRGAWEIVKNHLEFLGKSIEKDLISVVGIGDMAGDVFGNGMLYTNKILLKAAFNHVHIFIDPNPDALISYQERERLFNKPGSTWLDYSPHLISEGGGIFLRSAKTIPISSQIQEFLEIEENIVSGADLIKAILKSKVDMIWNGGIGTYIKSEKESHKKASDQWNDDVRVNGEDLKAKILAEGGNIGITQLGRIAFSKKQGLVNRDSIDNSAGVHLSDYEVNLKIFLNLLVTESIINEKDKIDLISYFQKSIVDKVLEMNILNAQLLSLEVIRLRYAVLKKDKELFSSFLNMIQDLSQQGILNLARENIDDPKLTLKEFEKLTKNNYSHIQEVPDLIYRPQLSIILSYERLRIKKEIMNSNITDLPIAEYFLKDYFSFFFTQKNYPSYEKNLTQYLPKHYLSKHIIAVQITNFILLYNTMSFLSRIQQMSHYPYEEIIKIYLYLKNAFNKPSSKNLIFQSPAEKSKENIFSFMKQEISKFSSYLENRIKKNTSRNFSFDKTILETSNIFHSESEFSSFIQNEENMIQYIMTFLK